MIMESVGLRTLEVYRLCWSKSQEEYKDSEWNHSSSGQSWGSICFFGATGEIWVPRTLYPSAHALGKSWAVLAGCCPLMIIFFLVFKDRV